MSVDLVQSRYIIRVFFVNPQTCRPVMVGETFEYFRDLAAAQQRGRDLCGFFNADKSYFYELRKSPLRGA